MQRRNPEIIADGAHDHLRPPDFSLDGITRNVRRGDVRCAQQGPVDIGLVFPHVDDHFVQAPARSQKRVLIDHLPAGSIDERCAFLHLRKKSRIGKIPVLRPQGNMQRHHIGLRQQVRERRKGRGALGRFAGRIAEQHQHAGLRRSGGDFRPDMADADHTQRPARPVEGQCAEGRHHILRDGGGIAARRAGDVDAPACTPGLVDMVGTDRRGGHQPDRRALEQPRVAAGAGAHHQRSGVPDICRRNLPAGKVADIEPVFKDAGQERNVAVGHERTQGHGQIR